MRRLAAAAVVLAVWTVTFVVAYANTAATAPACEIVRVGPGHIGIPGCAEAGRSMFPAIPIATVVAVVVVVLLLITTRGRRRV